MSVGPVGSVELGLQLLGVASRADLEPAGVLGGG